MMKRIKAKAPQAKITGVLLSEMAPTAGIELILGIKKAPGLGHLILVGTGGIYVEILQDFQLGFAPLTETDIERLVTSLKAYPILQGTRGQAEFDLEALKQAIMQLNQLALDFPQISELDINPLLVLPKGEGVRVLDARMVISSS